MDSLHIQQSEEAFLLLIVGGTLGIFSVLVPSKTKNKKLMMV